MLKGKLEKFIAKRVLIFWFILSIIIVVFSNNRVYLAGGLLVGGICGLLKLHFLGSTYSHLVRQTTPSDAVKRIILSYTLNIFIVVVLFTVAVVIHQAFLVGAAMGVLLVPFVTFINGFTEAFGLTHNNFE